MQAMNNAHKPSNSASSLAFNRKMAHRAHRAFVQIAAAAAFALPSFAAGASAAVNASSHLAQALPAQGAPTASQYFSTTGRVVSGPFLSEFNRFGLQSIGWPISDQRQEKGLTVQYFERVRMEYHPETASAGFPVLMTRLGADMSKPAQPFGTVAPFASAQNRVYVPQTGHSLSGPYLSFWKANGGLELFGYPISEPVVQDGMQVQWFERARFEYHPELAGSGHAIELTLLGKQAYEKTAPQPPAQAQAQMVASQVKMAPQPAQPAQPALSSMENYLFQNINAQRAAAGLGAVKLDPAVIDVARARSNDMATRNYFSHTTPEGTQFFSMLADHQISYKYAGEILARNNYPDDQASQVAMTSYLGSAPHKAIIMDGRYNLVGVGYAKASDGMHYFAVIFVQR